MRWMLALALVVAAIPTHADDWKSLFDGKTLEGWSYDPKLWSVKDGAIVGKTTAKNTDDHSYCVWKNGKPANFELELEFKVHGHGDSGVHYRSREYDKWRLSGYQADMRNAGVQAGALYEVHGRQWLCGVGRSRLLDRRGLKHTLAFLPQTKLTDTGKHFKEHDWNRLRIVCRGRHHLHHVNGVPVVEFLDLHDKAVLSGVIGLQLHAGPPMTVEYRNIRLRTLTRKYGRPLPLFRGSLTSWHWVGKGPNPFSAQHMTLEASGKQTGYLRTKTQWSDYVLRCFFRYPDAKPDASPADVGNSGVLLRVQDDDKVWPASVEVQTKGGEFGSLYPLGDYPREGDAKPLRLPAKDPKQLPGWNALEIDCYKQRITVRVNNVLVNDVSGFSWRDGFVGLQSEGTRVQFASIVLIPVE